MTVFLKNIYKYLGEYIILFLTQLIYSIYIIGEDYTNLRISIYLLLIYPLFSLGLSQSIYVLYKKDRSNLVSPTMKAQLALNVLTGTFYFLLVGPDLNVLYYILTLIILSTQSLYLNYVRIEDGYNIYYPKKIISVAASNFLPLFCILLFGTSVFYLSNLIASLVSSIFLLKGLRTLWKNSNNFDFLSPIVFSIKNSFQITMSSVLANLIPLIWLKQLKLQNANLFASYLLILTLARIVPSVLNNVIFNDVFKRYINHEINKSDINLIIKINAMNLVFLLMPFWLIEIVVTKSSSQLLGNYSFENGLVFVSGIVVSLFLSKEWLLNYIVRNGLSWIYTITMFVLAVLSWFIVPKFDDIRFAILLYVSLSYFVNISLNVYILPKPFENIFKLIIFDLIVLILLFYVFQTFRIYLDFLFILLMIGFTLYWKRIVNYYLTLTRALYEN